MDENAKAYDFGSSDFDKTFKTTNKKTILP